MSAGSLPLVLDFLGVFAFALNGALTAIGTARLDIVGIITLAMITALGGGIVRDILLGRAACHVPGLALPGGGDGRRLVCVRVQSAAGESVPLIAVLDAAGLSLFAVTGAATAAALGLGPGQAAILGVITGAGVERSAI